MAIEILDTLKLAREKKKRTVVMDTKKMHAWVHYYPNPGDKDDMHCHPGDQTFMCLDGECTMSFPDGGKAVMKPGVVALIQGGSFYQLENTGSGPMIRAHASRNSARRFGHSSFDPEYTGGRLAGFDSGGCRSSGMNSSARTNCDAQASITTAISVIRIPSILTCGATRTDALYSTVTLFAKFRGLSTLHPRATAA